MESLAATNWIARCNAAGAEIAKEPEGSIDPRTLMALVVDSLPDHATVVEEALTASAALNSFLPMRDADSFFGLASGGLGFAMPGAIGISLAQPGRPVVAAIGDGSAMYGIQALWTAAHLKLPITYVIINNRSYRIIKERLVANRHSSQFVGMDLKDPPLDFVALAQGFGMAARRVTDLRDVVGALRTAMDSGKPNLVEFVVDDGFGNSDIALATT